MPNPELKMKQSSFLDQVNGSTEATVGKVFEQQMGIDERVLDRLLNRALDQGGDFADLFFEYSLRHSVVMEEGIIKNSAVAIISGLGVRVVEGDQTGLISLNHPHPKSADDCHRRIFDDSFFHHHRMTETVFKKKIGKISTLIKGTIQQSVQNSFINPHLLLKNLTHRCFRRTIDLIQETALFHFQFRIRHQKKLNGMDDLCRNQAGLS